MAVINVNTSNTFEEWRVKTNEVATLVGDDSGLSSRFTATDIISALNEIKVNSEFDNQIDIKDQIGDGTVILAGESAIMKLSAGAQDVITLNQNGNATVAADFEAIGTVSANALAIVSNATVGGTLTSQGLLTANADIDCNGLINVSGSLTVDGNTVLGNQTTDTVGIGGIATIGNGLTVNGAVTTLNQGLTVSGAAQFNNAFTMGDTLTVASTFTANGNTVLGNSTAADLVSFGSRVNTAIVPNANNSYTLGTSALKWSTVHATTFSGTATTANYADLAELYLSDFAYEAGTVVQIGGEEEITICDGKANHSILGVVSAYPAYLMNNQLENGIPVALKGRVPVKVGGTIKKGDRLVGAPEGHAVADNEACRSFAIALKDFKATKKNPTGIVEAVIL
tara:strand:- start:2875 stop:4065 length:1191 start_codon:yes stop_codon:yes gene_type:complete